MTTDKIELRLSDVDPPASEPKRTIYRDIVNLPDPVKLGLTIRYFNFDDVGLYMQITGSGTGYTFGTVNLGLLASGTDAYINLDEFASRAKPTVAQLPNGEMEENITLTLKAYTDSGYTTLKWTFERVVTVHWINSADATWTVDVLNNFDDGTVQGWATVNELNAAPTLQVSTDYVLSVPYSLRMDLGGGFGVVQNRARIYKSFATPNKDKVYAIIDIRNSASALAGYTWANVVYVRKNSDVLIQIGKTVAGDNTHHYMSFNKWIRLVVPLPKNVTIEIQIAYEVCTQNPGTKSLWLDDFRIISK